MTEIKQYFNKLRPYLKDIINNLKKCDTRKIHLTIANNFICSIDNYEERVMHSKSDNIKNMINIALNVFYIKKYILFMFQNIIQIAKIKLFF